MSTGATTVSGSRPANASRRGDTRVAARRLPINISVHVVLITLAVLVWWIARDMVSVTRTLRDASRLKFELSEELKADWRVTSALIVPVSLDVTGPTKRINEFASELDANPGRYSFSYRIDPENLPPDAGSKRVVVVRVDLLQLKPSAEGGAPAELNIRPLTGDRAYEVTLEAYVTRRAYVDLSTSVVGEVSGYTWKARIAPDTQLQVRGPASKLDTIMGANDMARLTISKLDVGEFISNKSITLNKPIDEVLGQDSKHSTIASLVPREDVVFQQVIASESPGGTSKVQTATQVAVEIHFTRQQDFVQVDSRFPVNVLLPNWLVQRGARVRDLEDDLQVTLRVLASQRANFTERNVRVVIDLSQMKDTDFTIEEPEGGVGLFRAKPKTQLYYSLIINRERLTPKYPGEGITDERYLQVSGLSLEWTQ
ncbi:MAG: hypothetical protein IT464_06240 [Planctomycetes bacterium]|nr:hypothetical protein [Planctomycetota bacterium]